MLRPIPVYATRRRGFSLVLSLTVMAMLLLLCISVAALMAVELRVARASVSQSRARLNALVGARIALGELQRLAGPDQRITATADILCAQTSVLPTSSAYYQSPDLKTTVTHPRWVGVWNSGRQAGTGVLTRHTDGYLKDTRFEGSDWATARMTTPRLLGWLVSGNEALSIAGDPKNLFQPTTPLDQRDAQNQSADFPLLGAGVFDGDELAGAVNTNLSDMLGLRVRRVMIPDGANQPAGSYAFAVLDEGVKGRINLENKFSGSSSGAAAGAAYNLLLPQRNIFDIVQSPVGSAKTYLENHSAWDSAKVARMTDFADIALAVPEANVDAASIRRQFYHDITFHSAGVFADVVEGGLRKDLTAFLNRGDITEYAGIPGSGITGSTTLIGEKGVASAGVDRQNFKSLSFDPPLALIANWFKAAPTIGGAANVAAPGTLGRVEGRDTRVPAYTVDSASAMITPVITSYNLSYTVAIRSAVDLSVNYLKYVHFTVWNPYSVPLVANNLTLTVNSRIEPNVNLRNGNNVFASPRRHVDYRINGTTRIEPGQAITFIPAPGQDVSAVSIVNSSDGDFQSSDPITVTMVQGIPGPNAYYIDAAYGVNGIKALPNAGGLTQQGFYYWTLVNGTKGVEYSATDPADHYTLRAAGTSGMVSLQQVNLDTMTSLGNNGYEYILSDIAYTISNPSLVDDVRGTMPHARLHHSFRLMTLDEPVTNSDGPQPTARNLFMNANVRAAMHARHPYDQAAIARKAQFVGRGLYTTDPSLALDGETMPGDALNTSPLLRDSGAAKRHAILDLPRASVGLHSLGQLQHAPLVNTPWAPSLIVGNSLLPAQSIPTDRTALSLSEEDGLWVGMKQPPFTNYIDLVRQKPSEPSMIDWSFELNNALWDKYYFSGIPDANTGWGQTSWDLGTGTDAAKNSRYEPLGATPTGGYFADKNFAAYRAAYTLLQKGAFNVNSTSVVAWKSLLSAFRHLPVAGVNAATGTPFSRHYAPIAGEYKGASGDPESGAKLAEVWGGYRTLSDDELQRLAERLVIEVRTRGPFLSLADFINRRLKPVSGASGSLSPYPNWVDANSPEKSLENQYLGAIQAAIESADLNKSLSDTTSPLFSMKRDVPDTVATGVTAGQLNPSHKAKSKLAGAPGYLLQSDVLQQIGSALTARSDTFTIRASGMSEDGARAYIEMVVQRVPQPVIPAAAGEGLPINPKAIGAAGSAAVVGNQFMGRRFVVVSTKWLKEEQI